MDVPKKHYIRFYTQGGFFGNTSDPVVLGWNVPDWQNIDTNILIDKLQSENKLVEDLKWPEDAFAFQIYKQISVFYKGHICTDEPVKMGPLYYHPDSRVENEEEVRKNPKADSFLINRMGKNKWKTIVWTKWNTAFPFESYKDRILSA